MTPAPLPSDCNCMMGHRQEPPYWAQNYPIAQWKVIKLLLFKLPCLRNIQHATTDNRYRMVYTIMVKHIWSHMAGAKLLLPLLPVWLVEILTQKTLFLKGIILGQGCSMAKLNLGFQCYNSLKPVLRPLFQTISLTQRWLGWGRFQSPLSSRCIN